MATVEKNNHFQVSRLFLFRASFLIMAGNLLSRVLGLGKNVAVASFFGTGWMVDAFWASLILPQLFVYVCTSGMQNFIPLFSHELVQKDERSAWDFGSQIVTLHLVLVILGVIIGFLFAPLFTNLIVPGFGIEAKKLAIHLTKILMLLSLFAGLSEIAVHTLYTYQKFTLPMIGGVVNNVIILIVLFVFHQKIGIYALVAGVVAGSSLQLLIQFPSLRRVSHFFHLRLKWKHPAIRQLIRLTIPNYVGMAGVYLNSAIDKVFASMLPIGAISSLSYAFMLVEVPSSVFSLSLVRAFFPSLSQEFGYEKKDKAIATLTQTLNLVLLIMLPFTAIFLILGKPIIQTVFQRGTFTATSTQLTWSAFICYSLGITAYALNDVFVGAFNADKNTYTPMKIGLGRMGINIILNAIFVQFLAHAGLALATAISGHIKLVMLTQSFKKHYPTFKLQPVFRSLRKIAAAVLIMAAVILSLWLPLASHFSAFTLPIKLSILGVTLAVALMVYFLALLLLGVAEAQSVLTLVKKQGQTLIPAVWKRKIKWTGSELPY